MGNVRMGVWLGPYKKCIKSQKMDNAGVNLRFYCNKKFIRRYILGSELDPIVTLKGKAKTMYFGPISKGTRS